MRFDLHLRGAVKAQVTEVAERMASWEHKEVLTEEHRELIRAAITPFPHQTTAAALTVAGVDGSGDFPALAYADSFVYLSTAAAAVYREDATAGLREEELLEPIVELTWLPEEEEARGRSLLDSFSRVAGMPVREVIEASDYSVLKARACGWRGDSAAVERKLIRPHASDAGNLSIQLRSVAELAAGLRALERIPSGGLLLMDGTLSLPFVSRPELSLFHEHLKRLLCVKARKQGVAVVWISKSAGLSGGGTLEELAREALKATGPSEHWYLRLERGSTLAAMISSRLPPPGAVTYLVRTHRNVPLLRVDVDKEWWQQTVSGASQVETTTAEAQLMGSLDYAGHDQRSYGYPYPIKAAHDRASLTKQERLALRKQLIDAAVLAGMKRRLFRDPSRLTGHR